MKPAQYLVTARTPPTRTTPVPPAVTTPDSVDTHIGKLDFEFGVPTQRTTTKLYDEMDFQRAVQSYLWGLPIVGVEQNRQGLVHDTGAKSGDLALYDDYRSKATILAANNNTPYIFGFMDLSEKGPMVLVYPLPDIEKAQ